MGLPRDRPLRAARDGTAGGVDRRRRARRRAAPGVGRDPRRAGPPGARRAARRGRGDGRREPVPAAAALPHGGHRRARPGPARHGARRAAGPGARALPRGRRVVALVDRRDPAPAGLRPGRVGARPGRRRHGPADRAAARGRARRPVRRGRRHRPLARSSRPRRRRHRPVGARPGQAAPLPLRGSAPSRGAHDRHTARPREPGRLPDRRPQDGHARHRRDGARCRGGCSTAGRSSRRASRSRAATTRRRGSTSTSSRSTRCGRRATASCWRPTERRPTRSRSGPTSTTTCASTPSSCSTASAAASRSTRRCSAPGTDARQVTWTSPPTAATARSACLPAGHATTADGVDLYDGWTGGYTLDVTGGWYDAGDQGKYVVNGGIAVAQLLGLYERALRTGTADALGDGSLRVPERGNGVPDVLDEARWELDWMLRMRVPAGERYAGLVHHKLSDERWVPLPTLPADDPQPRYLHRPSTAATLNLAAVAAQGARVFAPARRGVRRRSCAPPRATPTTRPGSTPCSSRPTRTSCANAGQRPVRRRRRRGRLPVGRHRAVPDDGRRAVRRRPAGEPVRAPVPARRVRLEPRRGLVAPPAGDGRERAAGAGRRPGVRRPRPPTRSGSSRPRSRSATRTSRPTGRYDWGSNGLVLNNLAVLAAAHEITGDPTYRDAVLRGRRLPVRPQRPRRLLRHRLRHARRPQPAQPLVRPPARPDASRARRAARSPADRTPTARTRSRRRSRAARRSAASSTTSARSASTR